MITDGIEMSENWCADQFEIELGRNILYVE